MANFKFRGLITNILPSVTGDSGKGAWGKREFVVQETSGEYPNSAKFTLFKVGEYLQYATDKFPHKKGDEVEVEFAFKTREHNGNYYTSLDVFRINKLSGESNHQPPQQQAPTPVAEPADMSDEEDDLPF